MIAVIVFGLCALLALLIALVYLVHRAFQWLGTKAETVTITLAIKRSALPEKVASVPQQKATV